MASQKVVISVLADTKKFSKAMKNLGRETGLSKLGGMFKSAGRRIVGFFKSGIKWAGAFALAMVGLALKGGFERMLKIEDAEAKLRGLGHSTQSVEKIMDSALDSVLDTAYGLDEAATLAAAAVASGIKPGEELTRYLKLAGDAAQIAGTDLASMGDTFGKVAASNRVSMREINSLMGQGVPILQWLADEYDVTADAMREMVSRGEVDTQAFLNAVENNIGGAALEAGNTTRGAFANMRAALSRAGAAVLQHIFPMFKTAMQGITGWLDRVTEGAKPVGEAIGKWIGEVAVPAVQRLAQWVQTQLLPRVTALAQWVIGSLVPALINFAKWVGRNKDGIGIMAATVAGAVVAIKSLMYIAKVTKAVKAAIPVVKTFSTALIANPIGIIVVAIAALVAGLVYFFTMTETGRKIWQKAWAGIKAAAAAVVAWWQGSVVPVLERAWAAISSAASAASAWYQKHVAPIFAEVGELLGAVFARVQQAAAALWSRIRPIFTRTGKSWSDLWSGIQKVWAKIGPPILLAVRAGMQNLRTIVVAVWRIIRTTIQTALGVIRGVIRTVTRLIRGDWSGAWREIQGIGRTIWNGIRTIIRTGVNAVRTIISNTLRTIRTLWSSAWSAVRTRALAILANLVAGVRNRITSVINVVRNLPARIRGIFAAAGSWLLQAGRNVISGFISGLTAGFTRVRNTLGNLTNMLPSWKGPASRDKNVLRNAGHLVIDGFNDGLRDRFKDTRRTLHDLTREVARADMGTIDMPGITGNALGSAPVVRKYEIHLHRTVPTPDDGRVIVQAIREYESLNGGR